MEDKQVCWLLSRPQLGGQQINCGTEVSGVLDVLKAELENTDSPLSDGPIVLEAVEMTEAEFNVLPEFEGW